MAPTRKTNVVETTTSLVGRSAERAALAAFLDGTTRLITVVGPGGVGKTRLALRFASENAETFTAHGGGGVWLCDLTDVRGRPGLCATIAATLELPLAPDAADPIAELGAQLARRRRVLLVLDNCEHLARDAGPAIAAWLAAAPHLIVLVTSRTALGTPEEQLWPLAGLGDAEGVELFVRRARQVRPDLSLGADDAAAIREVVRRLDGLPLAIELAAARMRVLSPTQLRDRLAIGLLSRTGEGRHASMRGVVLESVASLEPPVRACFARCAVFRGGFGVDAAEAVLTDGRTDVLRALELLSDHSLLRIVTTDAGATRFQLYETINEVAREQLAALEDHATTVALHATYFGALARAGQDVAAETENLVVAHEHAIAVHDARLALALALALDPLLPPTQRVRCLDATLALSADAAAFIARGQAHRELGDLGQAELDYRRGHALATDMGAHGQLAVAEIRLGELVEVAGATLEARDRYTRALAHAVTARAPLTQADAHAHLGHALRREGELVTANAEIEAAVVLYRAANHREGLAAMAYEGAVIALFREQFAAARRRFDDGLALATSLGARQLEAAFTSGLGVLLQDLGEIDSAITHHAAAVQAFRDLGNRHREGSALYYLAASYLERGELPSAHAVFEQAATAIDAVGAHRYASLIASARGAAFALEGDRDSALRCFARAEQAALACSSERSVAATLAIHRLHLSALDGAARIAEARALVAATPGDDPRCALRVLVATQAASARPAWTVRAGGVAFRAPSATDDVDLAKRHPLRRILAALAAHRVAAPGDSLGLDELLEAGWPGEHVAQAAAVNRVHVALTTLRKLGLRDILLSGERGYLLDPTVAIDVIS